MKNIYVLFLIIFVSNLYPDVKKKAVIIGATSGMGRQIAILLAKEGYELGLVGRRLNLLESLQAELKTKVVIKRIDVCDKEKAIDQVGELVDNLGGMDLMVISISSFVDSMFEKSFEVDKKTLDVDLVGFWYMADFAVRYFEKQNYGHLVGISSMSGLRGDARCPVYCGVKAFISTYLEGIRNKMIQAKLPIYVTDVVPGWVDNEAITFSEKPGTYWVVSTIEAAGQIVKAIKAKKKRAFIMPRQFLIALLLWHMPDSIYNWIGGF
ncbi:MAG: Oxidoreductase [candidate division TM6 bacterium GW2011_GWF2_32_72]|nr:MAG: Oxidoreductase [candidate division TM6 bacterium GW2011_GWF2_32_72]